MYTAKVPSAFGVAADLRGAESRTSGVNLLARTVIFDEFEKARGLSGEQHVRKEVTVEVRGDNGRS